MALQGTNQSCKEFFRHTEMFQLTTLPDLCLLNIISKIDLTTNLLTVRFTCQRLHNCVEIDLRNRKSLTLLLEDGAGDPMAEIISLSSLTRYSFNAIHLQLTTFSKAFCDYLAEILPKIQILAISCAPNLEHQDSINLHPQLCRLLAHFQHRLVSLQLFGTFASREYLESKLDSDALERALNSCILIRRLTLDNPNEIPFPGLPAILPRLTEFQFTTYDFRSLYQLQSALPQWPKLKSLGISTSKSSWYYDSLNEEEEEAGPVSTLNQLERQIRTLSIGIYSLAQFEQLCSRLVELTQLSVQFISPNNDKNWPSLLRILSTVPKLISLRVRCTCMSSNLNQPKNPELNESIPALPNIQTLQFDIITDSHSEWDQFKLSSRIFSQLTSLYIRYSIMFGCESCGNLNYKSSREVVAQCQRTRIAPLVDRFPKLSQLCTSSSIVRLIDDEDDKILSDSDSQLEQIVISREQRFEWNVADFKS